MVSQFQKMKWAARIVATLLFVAVVAFLVAHGLPSPAELTVREQAMFAAWFVMLAGALVGWKSEVLGGILLLGGFFAFCLIDNLGRTVFNGMIWLTFAPFALAGLLYLAAAFLQRRAAHA